MNPIRKSAWLHIHDRKVLFARSNDSDTFYSVGGKIEEGETIEEALMREVMEEVSVTLKPETIKLVQTFTAQAHGKPAGVNVEIQGFFAEYEGELAINSEIAELAWLCSTDGEKTTDPGRMILAWLKKQDCIDLTHLMLACDLL